VNEKMQQKMGNSVTALKQHKQVIKEIILEDYI
jgi:hypothetical protein